MDKLKDNIPTFIDLFSGCGGLSLGFEMAGFRSILACDSWKPACLTFKNNFPNCPLFEGDVKDLNKETLNKLIGEEIENVNVMVGGPPCQGFSTAGKQWIDDPRNGLFVEFVRIISFVKPKYVVMENVPPILTLASGRFLKEIVATYNNNDYQVKANLLNSRYYGVPQERKRAVFLAWRNGLKEPQYPEPKALPYITCKEAISDLENEEFAEKKEYTSHAQSGYQIWSRGDRRELFNHMPTDISLFGFTPHE